MNYESDYKSTLKISSKYNPFNFFFFFSNYFIPSKVTKPLRHKGLLSEINWENVTEDNKSTKLRDWGSLLARSQKSSTSGKCKKRNY